LDFFPPPNVIFYSIFVLQIGGKPFKNLKRGGKRVKVKKKPPSEGFPTFHFPFPFLIYYKTAQKISHKFFSKVGSGGGYGPI